MISVLVSIPISVISVISKEYRLTDIRIGADIDADIGNIGADIGNTGADIGNIGADIVGADVGNIGKIC